MALNTNFTTGETLTAAQMNNLPWGVAGKAQNTSDFSLTSTSAAVPNCSVTWTAVSSRLYKTTAYFYYSVNAGTGTVVGQIFNGSGGRLQEGGHYASATSYVSISLTLYETGLSGTQTRKSQALYLAGGISAASVIGNSGYPTQIIVEDIGAA